MNHFRQIFLAARKCCSGPGVYKWTVGLACILTTVSVSYIHASEINADVGLMERAADWQLAHPSDHAPNTWTQAAFYTGVMALTKISESPRFYQAMTKVAETNRWQLGSRPYHADDMAVGQLYLDLYSQSHDAKMIASTKERCDYILAHPKTTSLLFDKEKNPAYLDRWSWCDALFMAPPTWLRLWTETKNEAYLNFVLENWWVTSDHLYDAQEHLYYRDDSFIGRREPNGQKVFWSRGNGWVLAGLARVLQILPQNHPSRGAFLRQYNEMAAKVITLQQPDGLWRASLLDPNHFPLKETSGTGFFTYALAWGINEHLLDPNVYKPVVLKAWDGLVGCVDSDGKLTHVQPIGSDPKKFKEDSTEVYGVGAFLLAGSEVVRLKKHN